MSDLSSVPEDYDEDIYLRLDALDRKYLVAVGLGAAGTLLALAANAAVAKSLKILGQINQVVSAHDSYLRTGNNIVEVKQPAPFHRAETTIDETRVVPENIVVDEARMGPESFLSEEAINSIANDVLKPSDIKNEGAL